MGTGAGGPGHGGGKWFRARSGDEELVSGSLVQTPVGNRGGVSRMYGCLLSVYVCLDGLDGRVGGYQKRARKKGCSRPGTRSHTALMRARAHHTATLAPLPPPWTPHHWRYIGAHVANLCGSCVGCSDGRRAGSWSRKTQLIQLCLNHSNHAPSILSLPTLAGHAAPSRHNTERGRAFNLTVESLWGTRGR